MRFWRRRTVFITWSLFFCALAFSLILGHLCCNRSYRNWFNRLSFDFFLQNRDWVILYISDLVYMLLKYKHGIGIIQLWNLWFLLRRIRQVHYIHSLLHCLRKCDHGFIIRHHLIVGGTLYTWCYFNLGFCCSLRFSLRFSLCLCFCFSLWLGFNFNLRLYFGLSWCLRFGLCLTLRCWLRRCSCFSSSLCLRLGLHSRTRLLLIIRWCFLLLLRL